MDAASWILYLLVLVVWVGSHVAFRLLLVPVVFKTLNPGAGLKVLLPVLPRLCLTGLICAAVGIVLVGLQLADGQWTRWAGVVSLLLLAGMGAATIWMRQTVAAHAALPPEVINQAAAMDKPLPPAAQQKWLTLRQVALQANAVQVLLGLGLVVVLVLGRQ
jgi:hypothetical protein